MLELGIKSDTGTKPPIVSSSDNRTECRIFVAYIEAYITKAPVELAQAEERRLSYYFDALDKRLTRGGPVEKGGIPRKFSVIEFLTPRALRDYKPRDVYETGNLKGLFQEIARQTRTMIASEVIVCPESMVRKPPSFTGGSVIIGDITSTLLSSHKTDSCSYSFGFFNIAHKNEQSSHEWDRDTSAIAVPVLALDDGMMNTIKNYESQSLLKPLQTVMTFCNHDIMHNLVNTISTGDISRVTEAHYKDMMRIFMEQKTGRYNSEDVLGFESALTIGHARTWQELKDTETDKKMQHAIKEFYDHLERIAHLIQQDGKLSAKQQHQVIDYFAMSIPYAIMRILSLHDPLMSYALSRAEKIDPAPDLVLSQSICINKICQDKHTTQTLDNYRKSGMPLAVNEDHPQNYAEVKKLQLAHILPDIAILLSPARKGSNEYKAHLRSDEMDRDIVNIIQRHRRDTVTSPFGREKP